jgi:tryptophan synthase alpha chain
MNRIDACFERRRAKGGAALIPFLTAGDPGRDCTVPMLHAAVEAGADLLELGVPFSDPMADGPVIQRSSERALAQGVTLPDVLGMVAEFRRADPTTPIVLMGYLNPLEAMGYAAFAAAAVAAGVDGILVVDLPPEEGLELHAALTGVGLHQIFLVAPTTDPARLARIAATASGFLYYVSLKGVTGSNALDVEAVGARVQAIKAQTSLPVGVGFGIKDAATAAAVARQADAVVVGSALVAAIEGWTREGGSLPARVGAFLGEFRRAMDAGH